MAHSGPEVDHYPPTESGPRRVAALGWWIGTALVGAALPALAVTVVAAAVRGQLDDPGTWVGSAMATSLASVGGLGWAFHVAAVVGLAGVWAIGLALVVEGYVGLD
jgi:hypothetical protein